MAWAAVYLQFPGGGCIARQLEAELATGIGATYFDRFTVGWHQPYHRIIGGFPIAETAVKHQLIGEAAQALQAAFNRVAMGRGGADKQQQGRNYTQIHG